MLHILFQNPKQDEKFRLNLKFRSGQMIFMLQMSYFLCVFAVIGDSMIQTDSCTDSLFEVGLFQPPVQVIFVFRDQDQV